MPIFDPSPFAAQPKILYPGQNQYLFGSWRQDASPSIFQVTSVAIASNVATVVGTMIEGDLPVVGSLISIRGTQTSSGAFNVTNAVITGVTNTFPSSQVTVTFALTGSNVNTTADAGKAITPQPEVPETLANGASIACTPSNNEQFLEMGRVLSTTVLFPEMPTTATVVLQGSNTLNAAEFTSIATVATVTGGTQTTPPVTQLENNGNTAVVNSPINFRFYRFLVSSVTGTGTIIARIEG